MSSSPIAIPTGRARSNTGSTMDSFGTSFDAPETPSSAMQCNILSGSNFLNSNTAFGRMTAFSPTVTSNPFTGFGTQILPKEASPTIGPLSAHFMNKTDQVQAPNTNETFETFQRRPSLIPPSPKMNISPSHRRFSSAGPTGWFANITAAEAVSAPPTSVPSTLSPTGLFRHFSLSSKSSAKTAENTAPMAYSFGVAEVPSEPVADMVPQMSPAPRSRKAVRRRSECVGTKRGISPTGEKMLSGHFIAY